MSNILQSERAGSRRQLHSGRQGSGNCLSASVVRLSGSALLLRLALEGRHALIQLLRLGWAYMAERYGIHAMCTCMSLLALMECESLVV